MDVLSAEAQAAAERGDTRTVYTIAKTIQATSPTNRQLSRTRTETSRQRRTSSSTDGQNTFGIF